MASKPRLHYRTKIYLATLQNINASVELSIEIVCESKPEKGGTPISTPILTKALRISLLLSFPSSSASKSVNRFSANIAKSSSSSKNRRIVFPSRTDTISGSSEHMKEKFNH